MSYATKLRMAYAWMMGDSLSMPMGVARVGDEADAEIAALRQRAEEAEADAARYRWARKHGILTVARWMVSPATSAEWDAAIDAARKETTWEPPLSMSMFATRADYETALANAQAARAGKETP